MRCKKTVFTAFSFILTAVLLMCMGIAAFAEDEATFYIDETVESDNTVKVVVSFPSDLSAAGTIRLKFNTDVLELISAEEGSMTAQMVNVNPIGDETIVMNYLNAYGAISGNTELAVLTFSLKADHFSVSDIYSEEYALYNINSQLLGDESTTELRYNIHTNNAPTEVSVVSEVESSVGHEVSSETSDKKESKPEGSKSETSAKSSSKAEEKTESSHTSTVSGTESRPTSEETSVSGGNSAAEQDSSQEAVTTIESKTVSEAVSADQSDIESSSDISVESPTDAVSSESPVQSSKSSEGQRSGSDEENENNSSAILIIVVLFIVCALIAFAVIRRQKKN